MKPILSIVQAYYRNPSMLKKQLETLKPLASVTEIEWVLLDDHSPEVASDIISREEFARHWQLYRVLDDIPWNQHGCRNLGAVVAQADWLLMMDMDRIVSADDLLNIVFKIQGVYSAVNHYKFQGWCRRQDSFGPDAVFIPEGKPIVNQFLVHKAVFAKAGGYDEDYCGLYGGDGPLLKAMEKIAPLVVDPTISMYRYDRHIYPDATTVTLERSKDAYSKKRAEKKRTGRDKPVDPIRFRYEKVY
jgi:predicted glycosyltransferase involved in capsule biosynthesis